MEDFIKPNVRPFLQDLLLGSLKRRFQFYSVPRHFKQYKYDREARELGGLLFVRGRVFHGMSRWTASKNQIPTPPEAPQNQHAPITSLNFPQIFKTV